MYPLFSYEGALPFICYDEYRRNGDQLCTHSCLPVAEVLKKRDLSAMAPVISVSAGHILLPGENPSAPHQLMSTEFGKNFVHFLFKAIWSMVRIGIYIERIEEGNIFMCPSGNIKFHNVKVIKEANHLKLEPRVMDNYHQVCGIAKRLFIDTALNVHLLEPNQPQVPPDIALLFSMVENDICLDNYELYHVHMSLVPIAVGVLSYIKLYDHLVTAVDELVRDKILLSIHKYIISWRRDVQSNSLLSDVYKYRSYWPSDQKIAERRNIELSDLLTMKNENPTEYANLWKLVDVQLFLEYLRNRTAHRMGSWAKGVNQYSAEDADNGCIVRFRVFFARLQKEMHDRGVLSGANIPGLFFFH